MVSNPFSNLFSQSPIRPMQQHIAKAYECTQQLPLFLDATLNDDWVAAEKVYDQITEFEHEADDLKTSLRANLPGSLMLPVDRSDLLVMVSQQDEIANITKDIAGIMLGRKMKIPAVIADSMKSYIDVAISTAAQAVKTVNEMDELLEMGFRGRVLEVVENLIQELNRLEHENDELQIKVRASLFAIEKDLPPVDVMFLYKIIEWIGELADASQRAGGKLQLLIAR